MKEKRHKGHSMYENTTTQFKNIYQEKSFQIHLIFLHDILEVAYLQTQKILKLLKLQKLSTHNSPWKINHGVVSSVRGSKI